MYIRYVAEVWGFYWATKFNDMNHQYRQDALNLMQRLCAYVSSLQAASSGIAQGIEGGRI